MDYNEDQQVATDPIDTLYKVVSDKGLYSKSIDEFRKQYSTPDQIDKLYQVVKDQGLYSKTKEEFSSKYFPSNNVLPKLDYRAPVQQTAPKENLPTPTVPATVPTETTANQIAKKHAEAQNILHQELTGNNELIPDIIKKQKATAQADQNLTNLAQQPRSDQPITGPQQLAASFQPPPQSPDVNPQDIADFTQRIQTDPTAGRAFLQHVVQSKPEKAQAIQSAAYVNDAMNRLAQDPDSNAGDTHGKVIRNAQDIAKGKLNYSVQGGLLTKPEDAWESIATGLQQKNKAFADYDLFNKTTPEQAISELEKRRNEHDPDEPIPVPKGYMGELTGGMAGLPLKGPIAGKLSGAVAGVITALIPGVEEFAPVVNEKVDRFISAAISSNDFRKMSYAHSLQNNYNQLRNEGADPQAAYEKANGQAKDESMIDAIGGAAMMYGAGAIGDLKLPQFNLSQGFTNAVVNGLKQGAKGIGEAGAVGLIQGAGQDIKNKLAEDKGIQRSGSGEDIKEAIQSGALFTLGMAALAKGGSLLSAKTRSQILQGLSKATPQQVDAEIGNQVINNHITPDEAVQVKKDIEEHRALDAGIPDNVTEESRMKIQDKIKRRNYLEMQLESADAAFHPEIKEKIKAVNEDILELAKDKVPRGETQGIQVPEPGEPIPPTEVKPEEPVSTIKPVSDKIQPTANLRTWDLGDMEGKPEDAAAKKHIEGVVQAWDKHPAGETGGETFGQFVGRVIPAFKKILSGEEGNTAVITHSSVLKAFKVWDEMGRPNVEDLTPEQKTEFATKFNKEETYNGDIETFKGDKGDIHVVRHGQTEDNAKNNFRSGNTNLTKEGEQQAAESGRQLGRQTGGDIPKIITSDLPRAIHTSNIIHGELTGDKPEVGSTVTSAHFEGERKIIHVGDDHVVVVHPEGEHIKHEIPLNDINPTDNAGSIPKNQGGATEEGATAEGSENPRQQDLQRDQGETSEHGQVIEPTGQEEGDNNLVGVSHASLNKLADKLGLPKIEPGTHLTPEEYADRGRQLIRGGADVNQVESDFKNGKQPSADDISIARAHLEDLVKKANAIGDDKSKGIKSDKYKAAKNDVQKWQTEVVKPMGTKASEPFTALQGERNLDTGSFTAIKNAKEEVTGKPQESLPSDIEKLSEKVKSLEDENKKLGKKLTDALSNQSKETSKPQRQKLSTQLNDLAKRVRASSEFDNFLKGAQGDIKKMGVDLPRLKEIAASILEDAAKAVKAGENAIDFIRDAVDKLKDDVDKDKLTDALHAIGEKAGLFEIKETPEEKNIRRLEKRLEELQQGIVKNNAEKRELSPKEKELQDQIFEEKKKLGLIPSKPLPEKPSAELTPAEKSIKRKEKELEDLQNGIVKQSGEKRELTTEEKDLNEQIFEAKKNLGLIKSKSLPKSPNPELSPEEKNIKRLEKQLEDLQTGNAKNAPEKRELSDREKELKEQIADARSKAGLTPSKVLGEKDEAEIKKQQYDDLVKQFVGKRDNKFTPEQSQSIWQYAKENYIDNNPLFNVVDMVNKTAMDLGLTPEQVRNALGRTAETKRIADNIYRNQYEKNKAHQTIQRWVNKSKEGAVTKLLDTVASPFRGLTTLGHGHALLFTHAGMNLFDPQVAKKFFQLSGKQFKIVYGDNALFEKTKNDLRNDKLFTTALKGGLAVDPNTVYDDWQIANNFLKKLKIQGNKGFLILKMMRMEIFKNEYNKLSDIEKADKDAITRVAQLANSWTGTAGLKVSPTANAFIFAPNLIVSKFARLTTDPISAIVTLKNWKNASVSDKVAAKIIFRKTGRIMATYAAALVGNSALLSLSGSNSSINYSNPFQSDWLKFKAGDRTVDVSSGMASTVQFLTQLAAFPFEDKAGVKENYFGANSPGDALKNELTGFIRKTLSPFGSVVWDNLSHKDYSGNVLPFYSDEPGKGKEKLDVIDYIEQKLPIPVADALKDIHDQMKEDGADEVTIKYIIGGLILGGIASAGVKMGKEPQPKQGGSGGGGGAGGSFKIKEWQ